MVIILELNWSDLSGATVRWFISFFRIQNIELNCSFVRCRKYHKSWWNGAAELPILVDLLCGTKAAELHNSVDLVCGTTATTAAELQNSVDLLCGTTATELQNSVDLLCDTTAAELQNSVNFPMFYNGRRAKQPGLMQAPGVAHMFQRQWRTMLNPK